MNEKNKTENWYDNLTIKTNKNNNKNKQKQQQKDTKQTMFNK